MSISSNGWTDLSAQLAERMARVLAISLREGVTWLNGELRDAQRRGTPPVWVYEQALHLLELTALQSGEGHIVKPLEKLMEEAEAGNVAQRRLLHGEALDALSQALDVFLGSTAAEMAKTIIHNVIVFRSVVPGNIFKLQAFIRASRWDDRDRASSSAIFFAGDYGLEADISYLLATDQTNEIIGASAILPGARHLTEVAPPLIGDWADDSKLAEFLTALHCVQHAYVDPDPERRFWSAVPVGSVEGQRTLRKCGFKSDSEIWKETAERLPDTASPDQTSWLSARVSSVSHAFQGLLADAAQSGSDARSFDVSLDIPVIENASLPSVVGEVLVSNT